MGLYARKNVARTQFEDDRKTWQQPRTDSRARLERTLALEALRRERSYERFIYPGRSMGIPLPACSPRLLNWRMAEPGVVELSLGFVNRLARPTKSGWLVVRSARLGAFADPREVERTRIPALAPGDLLRRRVRIPSRELGLGDSERLRTNPRGKHWIGNIDVYFEEDPEKVVERHVALGLRVPPRSRAELLMFLKDRGTDRDYSATVDCSEPGWQAELLFARNSRLGFLSVSTPDYSKSKCRVVARITRGRDGMVVPVEFTFETVLCGYDRIGCSAD
jgi:hypothetical protein